MKEKMISEGAMARYQRYPPNRAVEVRQTGISCYDGHKRSYWESAVQLRCSRCIQQSPVASHHLPSNALRSPPVPWVEAGHCTSLGSSVDFMLAS